MRAAESAQETTETWAYVGPMAAIYTRLGGVEHRLRRGETVEVSPEVAEHLATQPHWERRTVVAAPAEARTVEDESGDDDAAEDPEEGIEL